MSWRNGSTIEAPSHLFRTKTAVFKQLEKLKGEKLSIVVVSKPSEPVASRQSRFKFPDPKKDCYVKIEVSSRNGKFPLPIYYENQEDRDQYLCGGLGYILQVQSVKRFSSDGKELITDKSNQDLYCFSPFSAHRKGSQKKCFGFWFRFFGQGAIFRITVALKIDLIFLENFLGRNHLLEFLGQGDGIVASEEVDISTHVKCQKTAASERNVLINSAKIFPSLYMNQEYKSIVAKFKELRKKLNFSELEKYFIQALATLQDNDLKVVLFLEQSQEACRKNHFEKSKQLLKQAVDNTAKCKNKTLLMGRAYLYLSYVHQKDGFLGNAEECLAIARKKLQALEACEDVGDLCFQEGQILTNFAQKMPKFALQLINEAVHKFEQAAALFSNGLVTDNVLDKQCCTFIRLASLLLQQTSAALNSDGTSAQNNIQAEKHLEQVKGHLPELSEKTKFYFHVCLTELFYKKRQFVKAKESLDTAFQIAKSCQFEEQAVWAQMSVKSPDQSYLEDALSDRETAELTSGDCVVDDILSGYLGDESS